MATKTLSSAPSRVTRIRAGWRTLRRQPSATLGGLLVIFFLLMVAFGPLITPYSPFDAQSVGKLKPPSAQHLFGTDQLSRDVFSRVLAGSRDILAQAGLSTLFTVILGALIGIVVGYLGGLIDDLVGRLLDSLLALPATLLALLLVGAIGPARESVLIVIVVVYAPIVARVTRSAVLEIKTRGYIEAAQLRGERLSYILLREILPGVLPTLLVEASARFAYAIFLVASLGFLGIGVQPPAPDWGLQVAAARNYWDTAPWLLFFPCLAIILLVVGVSLLSDGLKQWLQTGQSTD